MQSDTKATIGKLNDTCRKSLESAAGLCVSCTHFEVELEHWLIKLIEENDTDVQKVFNHFSVNKERLESDLQDSIHNFKYGNTKTPCLSPRIPELIESAWLICSIDYGLSTIRSCFLIYAILKNEELAGIILKSSSECAVKIAINMVTATNRPMRTTNAA